MVLWCKHCGALLGLREPFTDWYVDRTSLCQQCAEKSTGLTPLEIEMKAQEKQESPPPSAE